MAVVAAAAMLLTGKVMAGGADTITWDNDASDQGNNTGYIYTSAAATTLLPAGDLVQLVAVQGGSNYVLAASTIGQVAATVSSLGDPANGSFNITTDVASNILAGAIGSPMGVAVYGGPTTSANSITIVPNGSYAFSVPTPNWPSPPNTVYVELDASTAPVPTVTGSGGLTTSPGFDGDTGFYVTVPEPSSIVLVLMGLLGGIGMIRRRRS